jgi:hypothetical protein
VQIALFGEVVTPRDLDKPVVVAEQYLEHINTLD